MGVASRPLSCRASRQRVLSKAKAGFSNSEGADNSPRLRQSRIAGSGCRNPSDPGCLPGRAFLTDGWAAGLAGKSAGAGAAHQRSVPSRCFHGGDGSRTASLDVGFESAHAKWYRLIVAASSRWRASVVAHCCAQRHRRRAVPQWRHPAGPRLQRGSTALSVSCPGTVPGSSTSHLRMNPRASTAGSRRQGSPAKALAVA